MQTTITTFGSLEKDRMDPEQMDLAHRYDLPAWRDAGCSDSKQFDQLGAITGGLWALSFSSSGANLFHDIGYLESGKT